MNKETVSIPKLVDNIHFKVIETPNVQNVQNIPNIPNIQNIKVSNNFLLNVIIFIIFLIFLLFFLYNCKYGIFKIVDFDPVPYSIVSNLN
jgi:hypothetical protein